MITVLIGKGLHIDVDERKFNDVVMGHVTYIGLRNILMDSHASIKVEDPDCKGKSMGLVHKKLDAMYAGILRVAGERTRLDAVEREARRMCVTALRAKLMSKGRKLNSYTTDQWAKAVDAKWMDYEEGAREYLDRVKEATQEEDEIDLDALFDDDEE